MRRLLSSLLNIKSTKSLQVCKNHRPVAKPQSPKDIQPIPYAQDHCLSCKQYICHVCSQTHVQNHCQVKCNINTDFDQNKKDNKLKLFNYGHVTKLELNNLKCICGSKLENENAAICAACGMASCSQNCHKQWQKMGKCTFSEGFYSIPEGFTMRSILINNILQVKSAKVKDWAIANRSSTTMICCYAHGDHDYVLLQRGYRNYGNPNNQLIDRMQILPAGLDYILHYDRLCQCTCVRCQQSPIHSVNNCQNRCIEFDLQYMKYASMKPENHQQCTCACDFCSTGIIMGTHRLIDCMPYCKRSTYSLQQKSDWNKE